MTEEHLKTLQAHLRGLCITYAEACGHPSPRSESATCDFVTGLQQACHATQLHIRTSLKEGLCLDAIPVLVSELLMTVPASKGAPR